MSTTREASPQPARARRTLLYRFLGPQGVVGKRYTIRPSPDVDDLRTLLQRMGARMQHKSPSRLNLAMAERFAVPHQLLVTLPSGKEYHVGADEPLPLGRLPPDGEIEVRDLDAESRVDLFVDGALAGVCTVTHSYYSTAADFKTALLLPWVREHVPELTPELLAGGWLAPMELSLVRANGAVRALADGTIVCPLRERERDARLRADVDIVTGFLEAVPETLDIDWSTLDPDLLADLLDPSTSSAAWYDLSS